MATFRTLLWWFLTIGLYAAWKEFYLTELMRINYKIWNHKGWTQSLKKFISLRRRLLYNAPHLNSHRTKRNNINLRLCGKNGTFSKLYLRIFFFCKCSGEITDINLGFHVIFTEMLSPWLMLLKVKQQKDEQLNSPTFQNFRPSTASPRLCIINMITQTLITPLWYVRV